MRTRLSAHLSITLAALALWAAPATAATTVWAVGDGGVAEPEDDIVAAFIEGAGPFDNLLYLGDVYEEGTLEDWEDNYGPSYGRFREKTLPIPGNHDWDRHEVGYDPYWGNLAPQTDGGHWYSKNIAGFQILALNSEEPLDEQSPQHEWLEEQLEQLPGTCTVPIIHKPRFTASTQITDYEDGEDENFEPLWSALLGHSTLVLAGHHHNYQRFKPIDGIVQFVVGSGGRRLHALDTGDERLAASFGDGWGALRLELSAERIDFEFFDTAGARLDSGSIECESHTSAEVTVPKKGKSKRAPKRLAGRTTNTEEPVKLSVVGKTKKGCVSFDGRKLKRGCRKRAFKAKGTGFWRFSLPGGARDWPSGRYTLTVKTRGLDGVKLKTKKKFRIS